MNYLGQKYEHVNSQNFDEYLAVIGVGYLARKAAATLKSVSCLSFHSYDDNTYTFSFNSILVNSTIMFTPGVEFEEIKPDGTKVRSIITLEDNKMIHIQRDDKGRVSKHIREFFPEQMIVTTTFEGWDKVLTRYYRLVQ